MYRYMLYRYICIDTCDIDIYVWISIDMCDIGMYAQEY